MIVRCHKCGASVVSIAGNVEFAASEQPHVSADPQAGDIAGIGQLNPTAAPDTAGHTSCGESLSTAASPRTVRTAPCTGAEPPPASKPTPPTGGRPDTSPSSPP